MSQHSHDTVSRLRRKIVIYALAYTLAALATISVINIVPLIHDLRLADEDHLLLSVKTRAVTIEEYLFRLRNIAMQITSRSAIRQALENYDRGLISLESVAGFTGPKLADAMASAKEVSGITRLDSRQHIICSCGTPIPEALWPIPAPGQKSVLISDPQVIGGTLYLIAGAPILTPEGRRIGTDIVLFTTSELESVVWNPAGLGESGDCLLARSTDKGALIFFPGRQGLPRGYNHLDSSATLQTALSKASQGRAGLLEVPRNKHEPFRVLAYTPIPGSPWVLLVHIDESEFYAEVNRTLFSTVSTALLLTLLAGGGIFLLLRPLTGKVLVYSRELESLNQQLQQEISERGRAEQSLRRSEQEWIQTFEAITDAVAILDTRGTVIKMNHAAEEFISARSETARENEECKLIADLARPGTNCPFAQMLRSKSPEFGELHASKIDRYFHIAAYPLADKTGELWGGVLLIQDITEQKRMEHAKDEMLSSVSHEMRTPLTAMLGFIEFLLENEVDKEQERDFLQTVLRETQRLNDLISNFLDLQRLSADLENYQLEPFAVSTLLNESSHLFAMASRKHRIIVECPDHLPKVMGDSKRLQQVMKNLLSNAIKYSPGGGTITLGAHQEGNEIVVSVKDEGLGIPQQALTKIFTRFYRVDDSDRRIPGGIGLGLALVKEMVKAHGGRVWAESTLGKGSTFHFTLPLVPAQAAEAAEKKKTGTATG